MGIFRGSYLNRNDEKNVHMFDKNKRKIASNVAFCRP